MIQTQPTYLSFIIRISIFLQIVLTPAVAFCGQVTMAWDENIEPDIAGYRIFCRQENSSYDYSRPSWEGTEAWCVITGLDENETYYAVVRAYNTVGIESRNSNEVSFQPCGSYSLLRENFFYKSVIEGETVTLSDVDNLEKDYTIVKYRWEQIEGSPVVLSDPTAAVPTFTAPLVDENGAEFSFIVDVRTADNLCDTAEISITINNDNVRSHAANTDGGSSGGCFISTDIGSVFNIFSERSFLFYFFMVLILAVLPLCPVYFPKGTKPNNYR